MVKRASDFILAIIKTRRPGKNPERVYYRDIATNAKKKQKELWAGRYSDSGFEYAPQNNLYIRKRKNASGRTTYYYDYPTRSKQPSYAKYYNAKYAKKKVRK